MSDKLQRTIQRFQTKIDSGSFYEAHQNLRTIANRYVHSKNYDEAIQILYQGASILLEARQTASGSDLISYIIEIYTEKEQPVTAEAKSKIIQLLTSLPDEEPSLKQLSKEAINWSIKFGSNKFGDHDLHHVLGSKLLKQNEFYDAELHLILGTAESVPLYIDYLFEWSLEDVPENSGLYLSRAIINYLYMKNIAFAKKALAIFVSKLKESQRVVLDAISESDLSIELSQHNQLLDFLQLLVLTVQRDSKDLFIRLKTHYNQAITTSELADSVDFIGNSYFDIPLKKQGGNMIADLMSGFFK